VRPLCGGAPTADAAARPQPTGAFSAADSLLPGVLMAWDFCHLYRRACVCGPPASKMSPLVAVSSAPLLGPVGNVKCCGLVQCA